MEEEQVLSRPPRERLFRTRYPSGVLAFLFALGLVLVATATYGAFTWYHSNDTSEATGSINSSTGRTGNDLVAFLGTLEDNQTDSTTDGGTGYLATRASAESPTAGSDVDDSVYASEPDLRSSGSGKSKELNDTIPPPVESLVEEPLGRIEMDGYSSEKKCCKPPVCCDYESPLACYRKCTGAHVLAILLNSPEPPCESGYEASSLGATDNGKGVCSPKNQLDQEDCSVWSTLHQAWQTVLCLAPFRSLGAAMVALVTVAMATYASFSCLVSKSTVCRTLWGTLSSDLVRLASRVRYVLSKPPSTKSQQENNHLEGLLFSQDSKPPSTKSQQEEDRLDDLLYAQDSKPPCTKSQQEKECLQDLLCLLDHGSSCSEDLDCDFGELNSEPEEEREEEKDSAWPHDYFQSSIDRTRATPDTFVVYTFSEMLEMIRKNHMDIARRNERIKMDDDDHCDEGEEKTGEEDPTVDEDEDDDEDDDVDVEEEDETIDNDSTHVHCDEEDDTDSEDEHLEEDDDDDDEEESETGGSQKERQPVGAGRMEELLCTCYPEHGATCLGPFMWDPVPVLGPVPHSSESEEETAGPDTFTNDRQAAP